MPTDPQTEIRAVIADWSKALSSKNAERTLSHYDASSVQYTLAPPLVYNRPTAEGLEGWFATWKGPIGYETGELAIRVDGDLALAHGLVHMHGTKTDGEKPDLWFRLTLGLARKGGGWKIVHEHESVPFYMDGSYKAAVDLNPEATQTGSMGRARLQSGETYRSAAAEPCMTLAPSYPIGWLRFACCQIIRT